MESKSKRNAARTLYASETNGTNAPRGLQPRIGGEWPLEGVGQALTMITSGNTKGKMLICVG